MPIFDQNILKRNIKELLKNKNITQQQLAQTIGMSQSNVSKALSEGDKKCFTVEQIYSIADHFGVSIDWMLGYELDAVLELFSADFTSFFKEREIIDFENKEIRLYGFSFGGNWANPSLEDDEFSFKVEYYYDWI